MKGLQRGLQTETIETLPTLLCHQPLTDDITELNILHWIIYKYPLGEYVIVYVSDTESVCVCY